MRRILATRGCGRYAPALQTLRAGSQHLASQPGTYRPFVFGRGFSAAAEAGLTPTNLTSEDGPLFATTRTVRNLAVIAHVDHGKTSLVDKIIQSCKVDSSSSMDSNPLERERGITILAKSTSVPYKGITVNIVDTPGHSDFGGEVERVLHMVDGVLLVVDAMEGPMPQTRYVLSKALAKGLKPILVVNKCDREGAAARIGAVENEVFDLFVALEANDEQLDFPIVYASAREGWTVGDADIAKSAQKRSSLSAAAGGSGMAHLLDTILTTIPPPRVLGGPSAPFRMLVSQMEIDTFLGKLVLGRVTSGSVKAGDAIVSLSREGEKKEEGKVTKMFTRRGMAAVPMAAAEAGDIVQIAGLQTPIPTSTVAAPTVTRPLYTDPIDPPTISMSFSVNDSPLAGKEGTQLTGTMIADRLAKEAATNVAMQVLPGVSQPGMPDATEVRGRGELQLAVLIETMRREGFELSVSPPAVLFKTEDDGAGGTRRLEPYEEVVVDIDEEYAGGVIEKMAVRKGNMREFAQVGVGKVRLNFYAPSRGLIGFQSDLKTDSRGTAVLHRRFEEYGPYQIGLERKPRGVMVANCAGQVTAYALDSLQSRGQLFLGPGEQTYMGHIIGECSKEDRDLDVNPVRAKKLTNIRAAGHDDAIRLTPPRVFTLEEALVYVAPDELVEVTPSSIRLRKRILEQGERDRFNKSFSKALKAAGEK